MTSSSDCGRAITKNKSLGVGQGALQWHEIQCNETIEFEWNLCSKQQKAIDFATTPTNCCSAGQHCTTRLQGYKTIYDVIHVWLCRIALSNLQLAIGSGPEHLVKLQSIDVPSLDLLLPSSFEMPGCRDACLPWACFLRWKTLSDLFQSQDALPQSWESQKKRESWDILPNTFQVQGWFGRRCMFLQFKSRIKHNRKHQLYIHQGTRLLSCLLPIPPQKVNVSSRSWLSCVNYVHVAIVCNRHCSQQCNINTGHHCHSVFGVWHKIECELMIAWRSRKIRPFTPP